MGGEEVKVKAWLRRLGESGWEGPQDEQEQEGFGEAGRIVNRLVEVLVVKRWKDIVLCTKTSREQEILSLHKVIGWSATR